MILRDESRGKSDTFIYTVPKVNKVIAYCKLGKLEDIMEHFKIKSIDQLINILEAWDVVKKHLILDKEFHQIDLHLHHDTIYKEDYLKLKKALEEKNE